MNYTNLYVNFLKKFLRPKRKLKVVFDCSNGTTGIILRNLLKAQSSRPSGRGSLAAAKLKATFINNKPDGNFSAHGPNPLIKGATRQLEREIKKQKADLGVIFDADGDRVFFVDNRGRWVDPNESAYILTKFFKPPYVVGIVSSRRLKMSNVKGQMLKVYVSRVGHYFFKKLMREKKASLGLEHSGHYYFKKFFYCDSGILAAIEVINFVSNLKIDFASWLDALPKYYRSGEINFTLSDAKLRMHANDAKKNILKNLEKKYKNQAVKILKMDGLTIEFKSWWFNLRPSNTEPLLRLNVEAKNKKILKRELQNLKNLIDSN